MLFTVKESMLILCNENKTNTNLKAIALAANTTSTPNVHMFIYTGRAFYDYNFRIVLPVLYCILKMDFLQDIL